jgi:transcriptional regulator with XRE-family HTH domain
MLDAFKTSEELQAELGERLRRLRLRRDLDQNETVARAGISLTALRNLESGRNTTVATLIRVLRALDAESDLAAIAPIPSVDPMAMLKLGRQRQRVRHKRPKAGATSP